MMQDIIIIGAGTAGLSAAIYGVRAGKSVLLLEKNLYGGQIINSPEVENYPGIKRISGAEFAAGLYEQAEELGAKISYEKTMGVKAIDHAFQVVTNKGVYPCRSVILATGAKNRPLGVERESELVGMGVSYCAACDGAFFRGKDVAVVGGGNTALEDAAVLSGYCRKVYLLHRRDSFRGEEKLLVRLRQKENVVFLLESEVVGLIGEKKLSAVNVKQKRTGEERQLDVSGLFVAVGQMPENKIFSDLVALDKYGYIKAPENCQTNMPGVFAAGDCRTKIVRQLATAAADGAVAALAACAFIDGQDK